jgi:hypothetical protein
MKEQRLLMVTTHIMGFQGAKVVTQVKEMFCFLHTAFPHILMTLYDVFILFWRGIFRQQVPLQCSCTTQRHSPQDHSPELTEIRNLTL